MNYAELLAVLERASAFELYRLGAAIDAELDSPQRIAEVRRRLRLGQEVRFFERGDNRLVAATVEGLKRTRVHVRNHEDGRRWAIPYAALNLADASVKIAPGAASKLTRAQLSVGDTVGFVSRDGHELSGRVVRLNPKTVTVDTPVGTWRVAYDLLHQVFEGATTEETLRVAAQSGAPGRR